MALSLSEATVTYHLSKVRRKLDVFQIVSHSQQSHLPEADRAELAVYAPVERRSLRSLPCAQTLRSAEVLAPALFLPGSL